MTANTTHFESSWPVKSGGQVTVSMAETTPKKSKADRLAQYVVFARVLIAMFAC